MRNVLLLELFKYMENYCEWFNFSDFLFLLLSDPDKYRKHSGNHNFLYHRKKEVSSR